MDIHKTSGEQVTSVNHNNSPILEARNLTKHFTTQHRLLGKDTVVYAVDDVSLAVNQGETLGLVGESGSGKTTVGRCMLRLVEPTKGEILLEGKDILGLDSRQVRLLRRKMQMVFQDPADSLNPRFNIRRTLFEAIKHGGCTDQKKYLEKAVALLKQVGMNATDLDKFPHQFSGGQQQRIAVARALALDPIVMILDEPTASLDVSVQSQVMSLLCDLQDELKLSYILISHDLSSIRHSSQQVAVMYLGKIVEMGGTAEIFSGPKHPYTKELIDAVPIPDPQIGKRKAVLQGEVPSSTAPPPGCRFHTRCPIREEICSLQVPELKSHGNGRLVACHLVEESN